MTDKINVRCRTDGTVDLGGHKFRIEQKSELYYIAVPHDPHWMMKGLYEVCERDAAKRAEKK